MNAITQTEPPPADEPGEAPPPLLLAGEEERDADEAHILRGTD